MLENTSLTECDDDAENVVEDIKVKAPLEGAAHFNPVAVALSATKPAILQEQSQRIVLSTQLRLDSSQDHLPSVGIGVGGFQKEPDLIQDGYGFGAINISSLAS